MGKIRKIVIAVVSVLAAGATGIAVYNHIKASKTDRPASLKTALVDTVPNVGDKLHLTDDKGEWIDLKDSMYVRFFRPEEVGETVSIVISTDEDFDIDSNYDYPFYAEVIETGADVPEKVAQGSRDYYTRLLVVLKDWIDNGIPETVEEPKNVYALYDEFSGYVTDEGYAVDKASVRPYMIHLTKSVPNYRLIGFIAGAAATVLIVVLIYAVLGIWVSGKKLALGSLAVVVLGVVILAIVLREEITTMRSIHEYAPGMYAVHVTNDYKLDEMLAANIRSEDEILDVASEKLLFGVPMSVELPNFGCSSFAAVTKEGTHLFGRNYDYPDTEGMLIYSDKNGPYTSIAMCDLGWVNMAGGTKTFAPDSLIGRFVLRGVCPHISVDGMNDQGLGVSVLSLETPEFHQNTGRPATLIPIAIRGILDTCANTDEAVAFLSSYDMHAMVGMGFHLFITDKTGHSVVAEWIDDELVVTETNAVTNYELATHEKDDDRRYKKMKDTLAGTNGVLSLEEAMDLLLAVSQNGDNTQTEWSCVYDLDHFVLYIYNDMNRAEYYTITPESFK